MQKKATINQSNHISGAKLSGTQKLSHNNPINNGPANNSASHKIDLNGVAAHKPRQTATNNQDDDPTVLHLR